MKRSSATAVVMVGLERDDAPRADDPNLHALPTRKNLHARREAGHDGLLGR
jgi:hypothetical protein